MHIKASAVIAAAGSGRRMGGVSKPNITLFGKTLFEYVLDAVERSSVDMAVVVCSEDNEDSLRKLASGFKKPIRFVRGGSVRAESVLNGVTASEDAEVICVHDCARPFLTAEMLDNACNAAISRGASCVCSAVTDTIKYRDPESGHISTPTRDNLFAVQTPQCFGKMRYLEAVARAGESFGSFTDETSLLENAGFEVEYIVTNQPNMKLTSPADVAVAEAIMRGIKND